MKNKVVLCSDLDRTILPNGEQKESPRARELLAYLVKNTKIILTYVSGRDKNLIQKAIEDYDIPIPDYAIGDVGTTIYEVVQNQWTPMNSWFKTIAEDWKGMEWNELSEFFSDFDNLTLQDERRQNRFKLSFYSNEDIDHVTLVKKIKKNLSNKGIRSRVIWSIDEQKHIGLLDVLPEQASKLHAVKYLIDQKGFDKSRTVFCGDSGNDLNVLTSDIQAVLVKNAAEDVRKNSVEAVKKKGIQNTLYLAKGGFLGMNGNYTAGVLEGLVNFIPEVHPWLEEATSQV